MLNEGKEKEKLAKSMMVIMVWGLFTKLQFAYAQFSCASVCGYHLCDIFWEAACAAPGDMWVEGLSLHM